MSGAAQGNTDRATTSTGKPVSILRGIAKKWDVTKSGNGEWGMGNGEWGMGNGEWGMGNGEWGMGNGEWGMDGEWGIVVSGNTKKVKLESAQ